MPWQLFLAAKPWPLAGPGRQTLGLPHLIAAFGRQTLELSWPCTPNPGPTPI
jgi:hypothetical protein